jgi:NADH:ubiquinone oxidoreductase subunit F (NADH-binding)
VIVLKTEFEPSVPFTPGPPVPPAPTVIGNVDAVSVTPVVAAKGLAV